MMVNGEESIPQLLDDEPVLSEDDHSMKKLAGIDELASLEEDLKSEGDFDLIEKETDTSLSCPNCRSKAEELIYCPGCGEAFCDHCASRVQVQSDSVKYKCPKCGNEFKKRKK